jgi:hypothetical protein
VDTSEVKLIQEAKRQLRIGRIISVATILITSGCWFASLLSPRNHDLAQSIGWAVAFAGLLATSDIAFSSSVITRTRLIEVLEAQINRDASALRHLSGPPANSSV